jgi:aspartate carbamoyltransferase catalytic subunit
MDQMKKKSFVSVADLSKEDILRLMRSAESFEKNPNRKILEGKVCATLFLSRPPERD